MSKDKRITELEDKLHARRVENDGLRRELHAAREELHKVQADLIAEQIKCARLEESIRDLTTDQEAA